MSSLFRRFAAAATLLFSLYLVAPLALAGQVSSDCDDYCSDRAREVYQSTGSLLIADAYYKGCLDGCYNG